MTYDTLMRKLRLRHGISLKELAKYAGVSPQRIQVIENYKSENKSRLLVIQKAFEKLIQERRTAVEHLAAEYEKNKERLLKYEEGEF